MENAAGGAYPPAGGTAGPADGREARAGGAGDGGGEGAHHVPPPQDQPPTQGVASDAARGDDAQGKLQLAVDPGANEGEVAIDLQTMEDDAPPVPHQYADANPIHSKLKGPNSRPNEGGGIDLGTVGESEAPSHPSQYDEASRKKVTKGTVEISPVQPPLPDEHSASRHDKSLDEAKAKGRKLRAVNVRDSVNEPVEDESDAQPTQRDASALSSTLSSIFGRSRPREDARAPIPIGQGRDRADPFASDAIIADVEAAEGSPYLNEDDEIFIPEATAVTPDEDIPVGTVVRPEKNSLTIAGRKFQLRFVILAAIAILVLAIVLAVTLTRKNRDDAPTSAPSVSLFPSSEPSTQPSLGPTTILQAELMSVISNYSGGIMSRSFADSQSAHRRALQWLVEDQTAWLQEKNLLPDAELVERFVVALIYFETYGDDWNQRLNFLTDEHICRWKDSLYQTLRKGVTNCSAGLVTNLTLSGNKLKGGLPTEIGLLKQLEALHFGDNDIAGSIPDSLGSLTNMTHLELQNNDLAGTAPSSLSRLKYLRSIDLSDNEMSGSVVDAGGMTKLENYNLAENRFSGPLPESFSNISSLGILHLDFNQLTGDIDFMCRNLPSDYRLDCRGDNPRISCKCCARCTFVSDDTCDPGTEKLLTVEVYVGRESINFEWKLQEWAYPHWITIAANGKYDDREGPHIHKLCVRSPGSYRITSMDIPDYPSKQPTGSLLSNSDKVLCDNLVGKKECTKQSDGKCLWDAGRNMCYVNKQATRIPTYFPTVPFPTYAPTNPYSPTMTSSPTATSSPTQYTRIVYSFDGDSSTINPNAIPEDFIPPRDSGAAESFFGVLGSTTSSPSESPSKSSRPTSSSRPSAPTNSPAPTEALTMELTTGGTEPVGTNKTLSPTPAFGSQPDPAVGHFCSHGRFILNLTTDAFGMDTSYEVIDRNDDSDLTSRRGFPSNTTLQTSVACLKSWGCYDFHIYDDWGDGICCKQGKGSYEVSVDGIPFGSGGAFGSSETVFLGGTCDGNTTGWLTSAGVSGGGNLTPFPSPIFTPFPTEPGGPAPGHTNRTSSPNTPSPSVLGSPRPAPLFTRRPTTPFPTYSPVLSPRPSGSLP